MAYIQAFLTLSGMDIDFSRVEDIIGLRADCIRYHDELLNNGQRFGHDEWSISTDLIESMEIEKTLRMLLANCNNKVDRFRMVAEIFKSKWSVLVFAEIRDDHCPSLYIPQELVSILAQIGSSVGFDIYFLEKRIDSVLCS